MTTALAPIEPATAIAEAAPAAPLPVFLGTQMVTALRAYKDLQAALDAAMPDQLMDISGRKFRKKGYWRAIAVAFNLDVKLEGERHEVQGAFADGRENFGYLVTYRATAPNGRSITGDGAAFAVEKAGKFKCPHQKKGARKGFTEHWPADTCPDFDPEYSWRRLSPEATTHNVRSHAHTRAFNRAVSNLVGFGEVSAEEVEREYVEPESESYEVTPPPTRVTLPEGASQIMKVVPVKVKVPSTGAVVEYADVTFVNHHGEERTLPTEAGVVDSPVALCEKFAQDMTPCIVTTKVTPRSKKTVIEAVEAFRPFAERPMDTQDGNTTTIPRTTSGTPATLPITADEIPF